MTVRLPDLSPHTSTGTVLSCTALVAGTTVGAGVLALPSVTFPAGVIPSTLLLCLIWGYTLISGLLIAEVNLRGMKTLGQDSVGLLGMTSQFLGKGWSQLATVAVLFLHYSLLVAYVSEGSSVLKLMLGPLWTGLGPFFPRLEVVLFVGLLGSFVALCSPRLVAGVNTGLVFGVMISFLGLLLAIATQVDLSQLWIQDWTVATPAIPVMLVAMFYHNVIPVVSTQLKGDEAKIRWSLIWGSLIPLIMFLLWNGVVLCSVGPDALAMGVDPFDLLRQTLSTASVNLWMSSFSLLAVMTSFIGVSYGLLSLFQDLWQVNAPQDLTQRVSINALVFAPPVGLCSLNPDLFISALSYAGTFSVATLYGLLPAILAWRSRQASDVIQPWVPGGRGMLTIMVCVGIGFVVL